MNLKKSLLHFALVVLIDTSCQQNNQPAPSSTNNNNSGGGTNTQSWVPATPFPSPNGPVTSMAKLNNELYVGGGFTQIGGIVSNKVAKWNGTSWSPMSFNSPTSGQVKTIMAYNNSVFIGCTGTSFESLFKWNGSSWVFAGLKGNINAMCNYNGQLVVAGDLSDTLGNHFSVAIGNTVGNWTGLGPFMGEVASLCVYNNEIYCGSNFVKKWSGSSWIDVTGITANNIYVMSLNVYNNKLIAGGNIGSIGGITTKNLVQYDGAQWSSFGFSIGTQINPGYVLSIYLNGTDMYIIGSPGYFDDSTTLPAYRQVLKYNGSQWSSVGTNMFSGSTTAGVASIIEYNGYLFAGGDLINDFAYTFSKLCKIQI